MINSVFTESAVYDAKTHRGGGSCEGQEYRPVHKSSAADSGLDASLCFAFGGVQIERKRWLDWRLELLGFAGLGICFSDIFSLDLLLLCQGRFYISSSSRKLVLP